MEIERGFGLPLEELSVSKDRLRKDSQGRERYLVIAVKKSVLAEYEACSSPWDGGPDLILPRHLAKRNG